ncbi:N-acetylmuramoyl-L-alanine amidase [Massilia sp. Leaf139]|uniref:N-acetylmuramoyl-L-alanine amidase n=1 Tax=Massilia sp. Leaf139 TaxID=1736272 RepID=UPI0009E85C1F|nr:N-acetylmuramoyl-L-alanine amidase [Massilia sp. Leaf139]
MITKSLAATLLLALLAGCVTAPGGIDKTYTAKGQGSRVRFLVLHYTVGDKPSSLKTLTEQQVSAHYLVTDDPRPIVYGLVDETRAAYHAGNSSWKGFTQLNNSSIGIEIVNAGWKDTPQGRVFAPFPQTQIDALIPLVKDIVARHGILPENVVGHSDIAPLRKQDPGPLFPWRQLAQAGLVAWPDANRVAAVRQVFDIQVPDALWFQKKLASHGFGLTQTGQFDQATRTVLAAFQMKYRPANIAGEPDAETAAMLEVLTTPANAPLPPVPPAPLPEMRPVQPEPVIQPTPPVPPVTPPTPSLPPTTTPAAPLPAGQ